MPEEIADDFCVYVPSDQVFQVCYKHGTNWKEVSNWKELALEARQTVEPHLRQRWTFYWELIAEKVIRLDTKRDPLRLIMLVPTTPSRYYNCPQSLAEKAILPKEGEK